MSLFYRFVFMLARVYMGIFHPLRFIGRENLPAEGRQVLICNHQSWLDCATVGLMQRRVAHFMAKAELFKNPIVNWFIRKLGAFPVKRGQADIGAIKHALKLLKEDEVLCIFPEGTRSRSESMLDFHKGAASIAIKAGAPAIPVFISPYRLFRKTYVYIGKPIMLADIKSDEGTERIRQAVLTLEQRAARI